jgi:hypothetical protein
MFMQTKKGTAPQALDASDFAGQLELDLVKMAAAHGRGTPEYIVAFSLHQDRQDLWTSFFMSIDNAMCAPARAQP